MRCLPCLESLDPFFKDHRLEGSPLHRLDMDVRIHKRAGQVLGEQYADRAFAHSGHSDQNEILLFHPVLSMAELVGKGNELC